MRTSLSSIPPGVFLSPSFYGNPRGWAGLCGLLLPGKYGIKPADTRDGIKRGGKSGKSASQAMFI
jgi:hypothetical protein